MADLEEAETRGAARRPSRPDMGAGVSRRVQDAVRKALPLPARAKVMLGEPQIIDDRHGSTPEEVEETIRHLRMEGHPSDERDVPDMIREIRQQQTELGEMERERERLRRLNPESRLPKPRY